jgi:hypothetical protein
MSRLIRLTNKPSDNFFAETLAQGPRPPGGGRGHHGARRARSPPASRAAWARGRGSWTARASRAATAPRPTAS